MGYFRIGAAGGGGGDTNPLDMEDDDTVRFGPEAIDVGQLDVQDTFDWTSALGTIQPTIDDSFDTDETFLLHAGDADLPISTNYSAVGACHIDHSIFPWGTNFFRWWTIDEANPNTSDTNIPAHCKDPTLNDQKKCYLAFNFTNWKVDVIGKPSASWASSLINSVTFYARHDQSGLTMDLEWRVGSVFNSSMPDSTPTWNEGSTLSWATVSPFRRFQVPNNPLDPNAYYPNAMTSGTDFNLAFAGLDAAAKQGRWWVFEFIGDVTIGGDLATFDIDPFVPHEFFFTEV